MLWELALGLVKSAVGPVFDFLNKRVDANARIHLSDNETLQKVGSTIIDGASKADELNAQLRAKEGNWGPTVICMTAILAPFVWHEWQMDSSRFIPAFDLAWGWIPYPTVFEHRPGSWGVPSIGKPGPDGQSPWDKTEQAIFTSFFIGATAAVSGIALLKAIRR